MKERYLELLRSTNREGIEELIKFLESSDFFTAPASTKFHGDYEGGLLEHSLKVYDILSEKIKNPGIDLKVSEDTIKIVEDTIPYGHGEKSVMMLTEYIKLTGEEKYAIRWHMGFSEPKESYLTLGQAMKKYPLVLLVNEADLEATYFFNI